MENNLNKWGGFRKVSHHLEPTLLSSYMRIIKILHSRIKVVILARPYGLARST